MSFHIMDTLIDKLFYQFQVRENPLLKKFSGVQNLRDGSNVISSIPSDFHQALIESNILLSTMCPPTSEHKQIPIQPYGSFVSNVHKLAHSPTSFIQHLLEMGMNTDFYLNKMNILSEVLLRQDLMFHKPMSETTKVVPEVFDLSFSVSTPIETMDLNLLKSKEVVSVITGTIHTNPNMHMTCDNPKLNQELVNRKTKELKKKSRKRRKRQKKDSCKSKNNVECIFNQLKDCKSPSQSTVAESDIFCDLVATGVQLLLPSISSFVISVESADEDYSDTNSDCEWLAEFEVAGLFVTNLTSSKPNSCTTVFAQCGVSTSKDELEHTELRTILCEVNKRWNEETKGLDKKPQVASKVTFAPDSNLVEVVPVDAHDRKGEWERYAIERIHFQRRINEVEKILSPCLSQDHRTKVLAKICTSQL